MNVLTLTLNNFLAVFALGYTHLAPATLKLALTLLAIEFVLFGIYFAFGAKNFADLFFKILFIGFWWWLINAFPTVMTMILNSFIAWGARAGGAAPAATSALLLNPSAIAGYGLIAAQPIWDAIQDMGVANIGQMVIYGLLGLVVLGMFFVIAIQVFITVLEFYLVVALTSVLLPFAYIKRTAFLAEKAIAAVISFGIKLMVLAFIITVTQPVLAGLALAPGVTPTYNTIFALILTVGALAVLVLHAPGVAAGIMAGAPSLTAGSVASTAMAGGLAVSGAGLAAYGATAAAAQLGAGAATGAARLAGGARAGAALGSFAATAAGGGGARQIGFQSAGAARGMGAALTQSLRQGSSTWVAPLSASYHAGSRAALGLRSTADAAPANGIPRSQAPAWATTSVANLAQAVRLASHASMPAGGGGNFRL